jgi:hypothetical protein
MVSLVEENRDALKELCVKFRVQGLEVFGSASTGRIFDSKNRYFIESINKNREVLYAA